MKIRICERCPLRSYSQRKPDSIIARLWRWHTNWCPGWRAYQRTLSETQEAKPRN